MNKFVQKTTLALAIAAVSGGAFAGDLDRTGGVVSGGTSAIVLANEVFGTGSQDTLVAIPDVTFTLDVLKDDIDGTASEVATVKFTLDSGAVFGEDLSSIDKWEDAGLVLVFTTGVGAITVGGVGAGNTVLTSDIGSIAVTQGGAIGDNTVTFELDTAAAGTPAATTLTSVRVSGFKVKNLTAALARGVVNPAVKLGAEFRNVNTAVTDTDTALTILSSQDGVELTAAQVSTYDDADVGLRARIDVADTELTFTGNLAGNTGSGAAQDFDETDNVTYAWLGALEVVRTQYKDEGNVSVNVKKEDANDFDFNGSDDISVTITSTSSLANYASVYLRTQTGPGSNCTGTTSGVDFIGSAVVGDPNSVKVSLTGETTADLSAGYDVCLVSADTAAIPESTFSASLNVTYFNPRYTDSEDTLNYGPVLRNGCQVTLFNVPNPASSDVAFIRLTNVSEKPGAVRAFMWTQDGDQIDLNSELTSSLDAHATAVYSTTPANAGNGYLGDSMPEFAALTSKRSRIVLQGAFPACEALGLVRTPANVLTNMTSTTYSGDATRLGAQNNGTSNTSN